MNIPLHDFQAVIFDMDGTIIDSEPFWGEAERAIFGQLGVDYDLEIAKTTTGVATLQVCEFWYARSPWTGPTPAEVADMLLQYVANRVREAGEPIPGTREALAHFHTLGYPISLATNSARWLIPVTLERLQVAHYFHTTLSVNDVPRGKPAPDMFLLAAERMGVAPEKCLVFEDSPTGMRGAKRAGMTTVGIIPRHEWDLEAFSVADYKITALSDVF